MTKAKPAAKRRPPLDRGRVLRAALALADAEGLEALSMRRLGRKLGVEAMSLYNHVADREDLLAGLVELVVGEIEVTRAGSWKEAMRRRARSMREVFARHPWAVGLLESRKHPGPAALRYFDAVLGVLREAGFSPVLALRAFSLLDSYAYGYAIQEKSLPAGDTPQATAEQFLQELPGESYPWLEETAARVTRSGFDPAKEFEAGLELVLDALERASAR